MSLLNKKTKIKIFQGSFYEIEEKVNKFVEKNNYKIIDIKLNDSFTKCCIVYTFSKTNEVKNDKEN